MKLRKSVFAVLVFSLMMVAGAASADMECHQGVGYYDANGNWHCNYATQGGNCLLCWDEIIVKG